MMSKMTTEHICFDDECVKWERIDVWRMIEMMTEHVALTMSVQSGEGSMMG